MSSRCIEAQEYCATCLCRVGTSELAMKKFLSVAIVLASVFCCSVISGTAAKAAIFDVTYSGTVSGAYYWDWDGLFGAPNTSLDGKSANLTFRFDTTLGSGVIGTSPQELYGGNAWSTTSPLLSISATVGGSGPVTRTVDNYGYQSGHFASLPGTPLNQYHSNGQQIEPGGIYAYGTVSSSGDTFGGPELFSVFVFQVDPSDYSFGYGGFYNANGGLAAYFGFTVDTVTVSQVGEAPIPAALPLFASVLLGGGALAWRRRRGRPVPA
jgi:hypothetical protein